MKISLRQSGHFVSMKKVVMRQSSEEVFPRIVQRLSLVAFWDSTVGKKIVMAVTGAIGVGYLIGHVAGNLLVFQGPAKIDAYAAFLKSNAGLLWTARAILLLAVILHIIAAFQLARISQKSRPIAYKRWRAVGSDFSSRTMRWTGPLVGIFIIYHLLHFTTGLSILTFTKVRSTTTSPPAFAFGTFQPFTFSRCSPSSRTYIMAPGACFSRWALIIQSTTDSSARSQRS